MSNLLSAPSLAIESALRDPARKVMGEVRQFRIRRLLGSSGRCIISSNCVGSRISILAREPFASPTINLFFNASHFLNFVENLDAYRALDGAFREEPSLSAERGYPVGLLGGGSIPEIQVNFMHYETFEDAVEAWRRRFDRVVHDKITLIFTDKDGATLEHLKRFDALPYPKLCFVHRPLPQIKSAVYVPGFEQEHEIGDLFTEWGRLAKVLTTPRLRAILGHGSCAVGSTP